MEKITTIDPETEFLASKRKNGNEWETFKENVRPLKRGRNVNLLNHALNSHTDNELKKSLMEQRRFVFIPTLSIKHSQYSLLNHNIICIFKNTYLL